MIEIHERISRRDVGVLFVVDVGNRDVRWTVLNYDRGSRRECCQSAVTSGRCGERGLAARRSGCSATMIEIRRGDSSTRHQRASTDLAKILATWRVQGMRMLYRRIRFGPSRIGSKIYSRTWPILSSRSFDLTELVATWVRFPGGAVLVEADAVPEDPVRAEQDQLEDL